jgi:H+-translocating NAD(P) transhydrogenase subunit alpha
MTDPILTMMLAAEGGAMVERGALMIAVFFIFVLAALHGFEIIQKVPATLHTPLMSGTNAISGITIVGAILAADSPTLAGFAPILGFLAVIFAMTNIVGGFLVTDRMLKMFRRR